MSSLRHAVALLLALAAGSASYAQSTPVPAPPAAVPDSLDFNEFGDADAKSAQTYATQKVLYLSPTKLISVGYEAQLPYDVTSTGPGLLPTTAETRINAARGLRLGFNAPVISRSNFILNLGLTYWNTSQDVANPERSRYFALLQDGLRTTGVNATVFKPLDNKHFILAQLNADASGNYRSFGDLSSNNLTYSSTAIFGWKLNDNFQWGVGATRTYRAGQLIYVPVLLYNRTFSPQWGCEVIFPARAEIRRSFGTRVLLKFGYELEGNAYYLGRSGTDDVYLRRGELKPRFTYERQLSGFVWLSAQAGYRYNYRNDAFRTQNPTSERESLFDSEPSLFTNTLTNPLYFNLSLNLVSP